MTDVLMPALTDQMEEGTIVAWLAEDGETVRTGQDIVEIETDKATMAHAADADGVLHVVAQVGDTIPVGEVIGRIGDGAGTPSDAAAPQVQPAAATQPVADSPRTEPEAEPVAVAAGNGRTADGGNAVATPLARRAASIHGVELGVVPGSGPRGRVTKGDVLRAAGVALPPEPEPAQPPSKPVAPAAAAPPTPGARIQQPTRLQQVVAQRMAEAGATVPHFQVQTEVAFDAALHLRAQLKAAAGEGGTVPSVNDLIVKACALALPQHPLVNGSFKDGAYELHDQVHVGIAVAADDGLVVATVRDADSKALGTIAREAREVALRVREGAATPQDLTGATFTVSNLGMYGMTAITAMINPPQAAILGVGAARTTLARSDDGEIIDRQLLTLTLSCDHRILNGADGSRYLYDVKQILENPLRLSL